MSSSFIRRGATIAATSTVTLCLVAAGLAAPAQAVIESDNAITVVGFGYEGTAEYNHRSISGLPDIVNGHTVRDVAVGNLKSYVLLDNNEVWNTANWGPIYTSSINDALYGRVITDLEADYTGAFALLDDNSLISDTDLSSGASVGFSAATSGQEFSSVSAGRHYALAVRTDGVMRVWGSNPTGGDNTANIALATAGQTHSIAYTTEGEILGFGSNYNGESDAAVAGLAIGDHEVTALAAGTGTSFALLDDGTVAAWGYGSAAFTADLPDALGGHDAVAISAVDSKLYVTLDDGRLVAIEANGNPDQTLQATVDELVGEHRVAQATGGEFHSLFVLEDATATFTIDGESLDDVTVTTADSLDLDAAGFLGGAAYTIAWDTTTVASGTTPASGVISQDVEVPDTLAAGIHTVVLTVDGQSFDESVTVSAGLTAPTPTISGAKKVGSELTAVRGTWAAGTTFAYSWLRNGKAISGATSSKYTATPTDLGKTLQVKVTGTKSGSAAISKTSAKTATIAKGTIAKGSVDIDGYTQVGRTVTAVTSGWASNVTLTYQWYANNKAISKATKKNYVIPISLVDKTLSVRVTAAATAYATTSSFAISNWFVDRGYIDPGSYYLKGSPAVGKTLTITRDTSNTETASLTRVYQWFVDGEPVQGATKTSFTLTSAHVGKYIDARVYLARSGYYPEYSSVWGGQVFPKSVTPGKVALTGTAKVGNVLTAAVTAVPADVDYEVVWYKKKGTAAIEIDGTYNQQTYTIQAADKGYQIYNDVYFYKSGFAYVLVTTPLTKKVV